MIGSAHIIAFHRLPAVSRRLRACLPLRPLRLLP